MNGAPSVTRTTTSLMVFSMFSMLAATTTVYWPPTPLVVSALNRSPSVSAVGVAPRTMVPGGGCRAATGSYGLPGEERATWPWASRTCTEATRGSTDSTAASRSAGESRRSWAATSCSRAAAASSDAEIIDRYSTSASAVAATPTATATTTPAMIAERTRSPHLAGCGRSQVFFMGFILDHRGAPSGRAGGCPHVPTWF